MTEKLSLPIRRKLLAEVIESIEVPKPLPKAGESALGALLDEPLSLDEPRITQLQIPAHWLKGQLLNVRNRGECYVITLLGEEDEPPLRPAPSGALRFTNPALCQDFVSKWYTREHQDPRAF